MILFRHRLKLHFDCQKLQLIILRKDFAIINSRKDL